MSNFIITPTIFAREATLVLNNNLVAAKLVNRDYEKDFGGTVNGYKIGSTVNIRRPTAGTPRIGPTAAPQDIVEGSTQLTINRQIGWDFKLTSTELTLQIPEFRQRVLEPILVRLANQIDQDVYANYTKAYNWVGTPGNAIANFAAFSKGPQRLDEGSVPSDSRVATLSPASYWSMVGSFTGLYLNNTAESALRRAQLGMVGMVDTYQAQNVPVLTTGARGGAPAINGAAQNRTYGGDATVATANVNGSANSGTLVKDSYTQTLNIKGMTASITGWAAAGEVFTIAGVYAVNNVTKAPLSYLQQFTVINGFNSDGTGLATITISPPIISSGPFQTVSATPADAAAITFLGTAASSYENSLMFHKKAMALAIVPMELPPGAVGAARETFDGVSVRVVPYYDGGNDINNWRLDILYGTSMIDPRLVTRISG